MNRVRRLLRHEAHVTLGAWLWWGMCMFAGGFCVAVLILA